LKLYPHSRAAAFGEIGACHRWVARQFEFESAVKVHDFNRDVKAPKLIGVLAPGGSAFFKPAQHLSLLRFCLGFFPR
jgi:hypothetical protein